MTGASRYRYLIGVEPGADLTARELADFEQFYDEVHQGEVVGANRGVLRGVRFTASGPATGITDAPSWLAMYTIDGLAAVREYVARQQTPGSGLDYTDPPVPWSRMTTRWRAILQSAEDVEADLGCADLVLTGRPETTEFGDRATTSPGITFQVLTALPAASTVPIVLTAYPGSGAPAGSAHPAPEWSRPYHRTGRDA